MPKSPKPATHRHTITFSGHMPADEMDRYAVHATNPEIVAARDALLQALHAAGYPHTVESKVIRPRTVKNVEDVEAE